MYPAAIKQLIDAFKCLPGVGPKTAERFALHACHYHPEVGKRLIDQLSHAITAIKKCSRCCSAGEIDPCALCTDPKRDPSVVLVVSGAPDIEAYERSGDFRGLYHALGGLMSPIDGITPETLTVNQLERRCATNQIKEIILGFDPTVEGEVTAQYLSKLLSRYPLRVSRIARGLPMGASVEYADDNTLANAVRERKILKENKGPS